MTFKTTTIPPSIRRPLGEARRALIRKLGGVVPSRGLSYDELLEVLFPAGIGDPSVREAIEAAAAGKELAAPGTIRQIIGAVEQQLVSTPFIVRMQWQDVKFIDVGPVRLAVDQADRSVSLQMQGNSYESHLTKVFQELCRPGMTVVDVGANIGYYSLLASQLVGAEGQVIALEPNSENVRLLLTSAKAAECANIRVVPVAADASDGWTAFTVHIGSNGGLVGDENLFSRPITIVPTFQLDTIITEPVHFLKMDVEGAEGRVLRGAQSLIERHRPIVSSEFSVQMLGAISRMQPQEFLEWFFKRGYSVSIIQRPSGSLREYESASEFSHDWGDDIFRIEDLLFIPGD